MSIDLTAYIDTSPMEPDEFRRLRNEIGEAFGETCTQGDLEPVVGRVKENISKYENGRLEVPNTVAVALRLAHAYVWNLPRRARKGAAKPSSAAKPSKADAS